MSEVRPSYVVNEEQLREMRDGMLDQLKQHEIELKLFGRGVNLSTILKENDETTVIHPLTADDMLNYSTNLADWYKAKARSREVVPPPPTVIRAVLKSQQRIRTDFRPIDSIVRAPVVAPSGEILTTPGYHPSTRTYYDPAPGFVVPPVPEHPTTEQVAHARGLLDFILHEFPFVSPADHANAWGLLMLPYIRPMIPGPTPLWLADAPDSRTGKSFLFEMCLLIALGHKVGRQVEKEDEAEWRKALFAELLKGPAAILIDNVHAMVKSAAFSSWIEGKIAHDRVLGTSETRAVNVRCIWCATGNSTRMHKDLINRAVKIVLNINDTYRTHLNCYLPQRAYVDGQIIEVPGQADPIVPALRRYGFPSLEDHIIETRATLVWSVLTLVKAWLDAGRPLATTNTSPMPGFDKWYQMTGGLLKFIGLDDFLVNRSTWVAAAEADPDYEDEVRLLEAWYEKKERGSDSWRGAVTAKMLYDQITMPINGIQFRLEGKNEHGELVYLGRRLGQMVGRPIGDFMVVEDKKDRMKATTYTLKVSESRRRADATIKKTPVL